MNALDVREESVKIENINDVVNELYRVKEVLYIASNIKLSSSQKVNDKFNNMKEEIDDFIKEILSEEALNSKPKVTCKDCKYSVIEVGKTKKFRRCGLFQAISCTVGGGIYVKDWSFCSWGEHTNEG